MKKKKCVDQNVFFFGVFDENILNVRGEVMSGCEESFSTKLAMEIFRNLLAHTANCLQTVTDQSLLIVENWHT